MGDTHGVGKRQLFLSVEKDPIKESGFGLSVPVLLVCPARGGETGLECYLGGSCVVTGMEDPKNTNMKWPLTLELGEFLRVPWPWAGSLEER